MQAALLLLAFGLAFTGQAIATYSTSDLAAPLLLWSNKALIGHGKGAQVSYEVVPQARDFASQLVLGALGHVPAGLEPYLQVEKLLAGGEGASAPVAIVYIGSQLDTEDLRRRSAGLAGLAAVLEGAASSMAFPYSQVSGQVASFESGLRAQLDLAGATYQAIGCSSVLSHAELLKAAGAALREAAAGRVRAVLLCGSGHSAAQSDAALDAELEEIHALQAVALASGLDYVFVVAPQPSRAAPSKRALSAHSRSLATEVYTVCGPLCQVQVAWLQGMLIVLFGALASCSGLVCLYLLDTPTRFATPKDAIGQSS